MQLRNPGADKARPAEKIVGRETAVAVRKNRRASASGQAWARTGRRLGSLVVKLTAKQAIEKEIVCSTGYKTTLIEDKSVFSQPFTEVLKQLFLIP
jgi:hypothetical protein